MGLQIEGTVLRNRGIYACGRCKSGTRTWHGAAQSRPNGSLWSFLLVAVTILILCSKEHYTRICSHILNIETEHPILLLYYPLETSKIAHS